MRVDFVVTGCQAIWSLYNLCKSTGTILHWAGLHYAFPLPETLFIKVKIFTSVSQKSSTEQISGSTSHPTKQRIHHRRGMEKNYERMGEGSNEDHMNDIPTCLDSGCVACCCWWFGKSESLHRFRFCWQCVCLTHPCRYYITHPTQRLIDWLTERTQSNTSSTE